MKAVPIETDFFLQFSSGPKNGGGYFFPPRDDPDFELDPLMLSNPELNVTLHVAKNRGTPNTKNFPSKTVGLIRLYRTGKCFTELDVKQTDELLKDLYN